jgi:probable F420-dependent oxidoreductase
MHPAQFEPMTRLGDQLGYESVWLSEHLVVPMTLSGQLRDDEDHPPLRPELPLFDAPAYLSFLAAKTDRIRLGTFVYLLALRHPFVGARGFATLDIVSGGRAIAGVGAGWLRSEWDATGIEPTGRGRRLEEAITVCRRLWREKVVEHHGEFYDFGAVMFEPKPVQEGGPPVLIGGESDTALRRAIRLGDGWIGMNHTPESAGRVLARLRQFERDLGHATGSTAVTMMADLTAPADLHHWRALGIDRLIVAPWERPSGVEAGIRAFAAAF